MALLSAVAALRPGAVASARPAPGDLSPRIATAFAAAMLLLVAVRANWILSIWQERRADVDAVERMLVRVPAGAALLPMEHRYTWKFWQPGDPVPPRGRYVGPGNPTYWHLPTLAIPRRQAFVPTLFAARGKQPVRVLPPWEDIAQQDSEFVSVTILPDPDPALLRRNSAAYVEQWRDRFDFLLVLNAELPDTTGTLPVLPELELVVDEGFAQRYRIVPSAVSADRSTR